MNPATAFLIYFVVSLVCIFLLRWLLRGIWKLLNKIRNPTKSSRAKLHQEEIDQISARGNRVREPHEKLQSAIPITVEAFNSDAFEKRVGILITNKTQNKITGLRVELKPDGLIVKDKDADNTILQVPSYCCRFPYGNEEDTNAIPARGKLIIYVAEVNDKNFVVFRLPKPVIPYRFETGLLDFEIDLAIRAGGVNPIPFRGNIHFEPETPAKIGQALEWTPPRPASIVIMETL